MKDVIIIIRPNKYYETKKALTENRFFSMSTKKVLGKGKNGVLFEPQYPDSQADEYIHNDILVAKRIIDIIVKDEDVDRLIKIVLKINSNGISGDGKIFVLPVEQCIRIHTGEKGEDAII